MVSGRPRPGVWRRLRWLLGGLVLLVALGLGWAAWQLHQRPSLAPFAQRWLPPAAPAATLRIMFLGVSTVLLDDGHTQLLVDGFFTRPPLRTVLFGRVTPDPALIQAALARAGVQRLAAVVTVHSHYDHAMDAPEVARQTGALVVGSPSTANIARGWGLPESRVRSVGDGDRLQFGAWQLQVFESRHVPTPVTGGTIDTPLKPPVRATDYAEGGSFSLLLRHGSRSLLVQGSAGYVPGRLAGQPAEVVLLGVGALGKQGDAYLADYWREVVGHTGARRIIPIHWDDFTLPLDQPLQAGPNLIDDVARSLHWLAGQGARTGVDMKLAPAWVWVDPFAGL